MDGTCVESVGDEYARKPGVNALAFTYDYALKPELAPLALANQSKRNRIVSRMLHINESSGDILTKLEAVRVLCQETGRAQRYPGHDPGNGIPHAGARLDDAGRSTELRARFAVRLGTMPNRRLALRPAA